MPFGELAVGRFEVTRAQLADFAKAVLAKRRGYRLHLPAGRREPAGDRPLLRKAKAYAAWAAAKLAASGAAGVRLPTEDEARKLADKAGSGGNTLDKWLGYGANPDDADKARAAAAAAGETLLLLPVGEGAPARAADDGAGVYDLDGNAAEWATGPDGKAVAVGPSADRANDAADRHAAGRRLHRLSPGGQALTHRHSPTPRKEHP